jgi:hypothetical protein
VHLLVAGAWREPLPAISSDPMAQRSPKRGRLSGSIPRGCRADQLAGVGGSLPWAKDRQWRDQANDLDQHVCPPYAIDPGCG